MEAGSFGDEPSCAYPRVPGHRSLRQGDVSGRNGCKKVPAMRVSYFPLGAPLVGDGAVVLGVPIEFPEVP